MRSIQALKGRRQFLFGALAASTVGVISGKVTRAFSPKSFAGIAMPSEAVAGERGSETTEGIVAEGKLSDRYSHLLSPIKIGNVILKSRMYSTNAVIHFLQGPENYPAESSRFYAANLAKNGAAIITCRLTTATMKKVPRNELPDDSAHMVVYDLEDTGVQNYIDRMVEAIHCYGAKACVPYYVLPPDQDTIPPSTKHLVDPLPRKDSKKMIEDAVARAKYFQARGFDMVELEMLQYTGDMKRRLSFSVDVCQAIKEACGPDFLIESKIRVTDSPEELQDPLSITMKEAIELAKIWEGSVDLLMISGDRIFFDGWTTEKNKYLPHLNTARAIKESGAKITVAPNGGFQDLDLNEEYIAAGKADMIAMGRAWITDWEYGKKAYEGRGEDVAPCIKCDKCHGQDQKNGPWFPVCSVNPKVGIPIAVGMIEAPSAKQKVAIIGGGPAGMKAALVAAERGHQVTLYEKSDTLGGLLRHTDYSPFKWPLKDYKNYLILQLNKSGVRVLLNTEATPAAIKAKGYDVVMAAVGAKPTIPRLPGSDGKNVWNVVEAHSNETRLGKNVVVIGVGEYGVETGMFLAKSGHKVTSITSAEEVLTKKGPHHEGIVIDTYEKMENYNYITGAIPKGISDGKIVYSDAEGDEKSIRADSVVIYAGLKPLQDEALEFSGSAKRFFVIGDCSGDGGNVQKCVRSAFFAASQI